MAAGVTTVAVAALAASASAYDFACSNAGCECSGSNCGKSVFHWTSWCRVDKMYTGANYYDPWFGSPYWWQDCNAAPRCDDVSPPVCRHCSDIFPPPTPNVTEDVPPPAPNATA